MDIDDVKRRVRAGQYVFSLHADIRRKAADLTLAQVRAAILQGELLEQYADTGRGESGLIVGFAGETPLHIVCGRLGERVVIVTVYVPGPPKFVDPWTRGGPEGE